MAYALEAWQVDAFTGRFALWKPNPERTDANSRVTEPFGYPVEPTYSDVRGRWQPKPHLSQPRTFGRSDFNIVETTDILRLHLSQEIADGWLVRIDTPGHPERGVYFETQGGTQTNDLFAKVRKVYMKRVNRPVFKDV